MVTSRWNHSIVISIFACIRYAINLQYCFVSFYHFARIEYRELLVSHSQAGDKTSDVMAIIL